LRGAQHTPAATPAWCWFTTQLCCCSHVLQRATRPFNKQRLRASPCVSNAGLRHAQRGPRRLEQAKALDSANVDVPQASLPLQRNAMHACSMASWLPQLPHTAMLEERMARLPCPVHGARHSVGVAAAGAAQLEKSARPRRAVGSLRGCSRRNAVVAASSGSDPGTAAVSRHRTVELPVHE
jgi:hypothetical protein